MKVIILLLQTQNPLLNALGFHIPLGMIDCSIFCLLSESTPLKATLIRTTKPGGITIAILQENQVAIM